MYIPICTAVQKSRRSHSMKFSTFLYRYSQALVSTVHLLVGEANSLKALSLGNGVTYCIQDVQC